MRAYSNTKGEDIYVESTGCEEVDGETRVVI